MGVGDVSKKKKIGCSIFVGGVPIEQLTPEERDAWETRVVEIYERIILERIESMQEAGKSKEEIMKYLAIN